MALEGVAERPIVGWGQEGFNYVFNKYYDPSLYAQEAWFDRAHNAFIDWLTAGGIPAFLLYLSLFGTAITLLWRSSELSRPERIALTAALVGYGVHNLFVFDNLYSYVYFFVILALIDSQVARPIERLEKAPVLGAAEGMAYALPIATVVAVALIWFVNVSGMNVASELIVALSPQMDVNVFEVSATNIWPNDPESHMTLAAAYYATGRTSDAVAQLQAAEKLAPSGAAGDSIKAQSDTLIQEVTGIGTGRGVPKHVKYFESAIQSIRDKSAALVSSVTQQLIVAEQNKEAVLPSNADQLNTQISNLQAEVSILDALRGTSSDILLREINNDRVKGLLRNIEDFSNLAAHPSFAAQEVREQIVSFAASIAQNSSATDAQKQQAVTLAVTEMRKQVAAYPLDAREHLELSYAYRAGGDAADTLKEIQAAALLSPGKEEILIEEGSTEWDMGNVTGAQAAFNKAYALGPQFKDLATYAAAGDIVAGDTATADKLLISVFGTTAVDSDILAVAYYRTKNWPSLIALWAKRAAAPGATVNTWFSLASAYYVAGDTTGAINTINKAVTLFPDAATSGAAAIKQIEGGKPAGQ